MRSGNSTSLMAIAELKLAGDRLNKVMSVGT